MKICQICQEPIWETAWPGSRGGVTKKFVCFYCFSRIKNGDYKPTVVNNDGFLVCDKCGEVSEDMEKTDEGWLCGDCCE